MDTLHEIDDEAKAQQLAADMDARGWHGAPLIADGTQLLTGAHRYHAWTRICERPASEIPIVDIRDLFATQNLDYDALMADEAFEGLDWWERLLIVVRENLSADVLHEYGIDIE